MKKNPKCFVFFQTNESQDLDFGVLPYLAYLIKYKRLSQEKAENVARAKYGDLFLNNSSLKVQIMEYAKVCQERLRRAESGKLGQIGRFFAQNWFIIVIVAIVGCLVGGALLKNSDKILGKMRKFKKQ